MAKLALSVATGDYDRVRAIKDGALAVEGCTTNYVTLEAEEMFFRAVRHAEFDVSELSFSSYLMQLDRGTSAYVGLPVFPSRAFRHSAIFVRADRGISKPGDLRGKTVGCPEYQMTAIVWIRGLLEDEYGIAPGDMKWRTGGLEQPGRVERTPLDPPPPGVEIQPIPADRTLSRMLETGEIDALFVARPPSCFARGAADVVRLFPDFRAAEEAYFRKTGIFPVMHLLGLRRELAIAHPWLPASLCKAFETAKSMALAELGKTGALGISLAWIAAELEATKKVLGADPWPYGVAANHAALDALCRYAHRQSLVSKRFAPADLFAPSTLEASRI